MLPRITGNQGQPGQNGISLRHAGPLPEQAPSGTQLTSAAGGVNVQAIAIPKWMPSLMYHRVVPNLARPDPHKVVISTDEFDAQMRFLKSRSYNSVSMDDWALSLLNPEKAPTKIVVITFDDGYLDFYLHAYPILEKHGFTATVFLVSGYLGATNAWDRGRLPEAPLMGPEHIRELKQRGISFGSHSATHRWLPDLPPEQVWKEVAGSRTALEQLLESKVLSFSFPYGASNTAVRRLVQQAGYLTACGIGPPRHLLYNTCRIDAARHRGASLSWRADLTGFHYLLRQNIVFRRLRRWMKKVTRHRSSRRGRGPPGVEEFPTGME